MENNQGDIAKAQELYDHIISMDSDVFAAFLFFVVMHANNRQAAGEQVLDKMQEHMNYAHSLSEVLQCVH